MRRFPVTIIALILMMSVLACDFAGISIDLGGGDEEKVSEDANIDVGIDAPLNGASLAMAPVDIAYHATCVDGIAAVELSIDGGVADGYIDNEAEQKVVALKHAWQPEVPGNHTIQVRAMGASGDWSEPQMISVVVQAQQAEAETQPQPQQPVATPFIQDTPEPPPQPQQPTETPEDVTIFDIKHDADIFYYGSRNCGSTKVTITAQVTHADKVHGLYIFTRFAEYNGSGLTKWDSGTHLSKKSDGVYSITIESDTLANYSTFRDAIMNFQLVAQDKSGTILARSEVNKKITLKRCN